MMEPLALRTETDIEIQQPRIDDAACPVESRETSCLGPRPEWPDDAASRAFRNRRVDWCVRDHDVFRGLYQRDDRAAGCE